MTPRQRIESYFEDCGTGTAADVAGHFTPDAVIFDTNLAPARGADAIGRLWLAVREKWGGARWTVDSCVESADGRSAAIEWTMVGRAPGDGRSFAFRGSEHYRFEGDLIAEIRQYWTFDPERLDTGLREYPYDV